MQKKFFNKQGTVKPFPLYVYVGTLGTLTLSGIIASIYLMYSHHRVYTDISYQSFCALSKSINCDTVAQSTYSVFLGAPLALWGLVGYIAFGLLLIWFRIDAERKRGFGLLFLTGLVFSAISILLGYISGRHINAYCIMCLFCFLVNFMLFFFSWLTHRRFDRMSLIKTIIQDIHFLFTNFKIVAFMIIPFVLLTVVIVKAYTPYWKFELSLTDESIRSGITPDGHPWIGAENPEITIEEFSDYMCFQCKKIHWMLRKLVTNNPHRVRIIHRHFPMDQVVNPLVKEPFHKGSGTLSLFAIYAAEKDRFWEMNDFLFGMDWKRKTITISEIANHFGFNAKEMAKEFNSPEAHQRLWSDIARGLRLGLNGTPGFLINENLYIGEIPAEILKPFLEKTRIKLNKGQSRRYIVSQADNR